MKILAVNAGSSSLKFQAYEMPEEKILMSGTFEKIGESNSFYTIKFNGEKIKKEIDLPTHKVAVEMVAKELLDNKIINSLNEIKGIGHRVVHGGDKYSSSVIIDNDVISTVESLSQLAPLHNPANITGINAFINMIPDAVQVACFDTAFHQTMDEVAYTYPLPYEWREKYGIRKYGFHGMSHRFVSERASELLQKENAKVIVCHLGNGASITAVENGKSIDTTMGFTPNAGLMMGTRCGDIDASILPFMMDKLNLSTKEIDNIINKESGMLGISGLSNDSRDIEKASEAGNERCFLVQKMYARRVIEYISKYYVLLKGADAICFTAGIGENSPLTREKVLNGLEVLGVKLDVEANKVRAEEKLISTVDSKIKCYVIPTNEELMIARDAYNLVLGNNNV